ncbi:hypothetical protein [Deinococcus sp. Leaf326]|uniref:hypothetical protein n=1 Tax=Deinococcus sp. Leaf326 TaxID=1736338 RepID=UPI0006F87300|nr:hypothetical protein [Deinococcus sp. Leaf326]KQR37724.1 hypothetical protein ASF71_14685 [Deinococcus sp. Leaf326]
MAAQINWYAPDGVTLLSGQVPFGNVKPGAQKSLTWVYRNVGDAPAEDAVLTVRPVGAVDLEDWISGMTGSQSFSRAAPLSLGDLAPGAEGTVTLTLAVPPDAELSSRPLMAQPGIAYDLEA